MRPRRIDLSTMPKPKAKVMQPKRSDPPQKKEVLSGVNPVE